ncbi:MAG: hypothetical protein ACP5FH_01870 [Terracidiphilus sp.]
MSPELLPPPAEVIFAHTIRISQIRRIHAGFKQTHELTNLCFTQIEIAH